MPAPIGLVKRNEMDRGSAHGYVQSPYPTPQLSSEVDYCANISELRRPVNGRNGQDAAGRRLARALSRRRR